MTYDLTEHLASDHFRVHPPMPWDGVLAHLERWREQPDYGLRITPSPTENPQP